MSFTSTTDLYGDNKEGLLLRETGDWTPGKLYFLAMYISRFVVSMKSKEWRSVNYIDLFSGPGKNRLPDNKIILGSPLIALSQRVLFDRYYFADIESNNINALKQRCANYSTSTNINYCVGDANVSVNHVVDEIKALNTKYVKGKWSSLNLAFLDPEGLELHWSTVERLAELRTDLIIYYSQMGITRNASEGVTMPPATSIDRFFGDTNWRQIYQENQVGNKFHRALLDYYKSKLEGFGYQIKDPLDEPLFRNSKETPLYRLLFVSKDPLGNRFWNDVTKKYITGQMRLF